MSELNIDSTYGVMIIKDFEPVYVDDNYARIFGYQSSDELMSSISSVLDLIDPQFHQLARENYYLLTSGKKIPRGKTFKNIDRNGRQFSVFTVDHVIEWEGEPAIQVTVIDMSMVEEANQRIRENNLKYQKLIVNSGQGISVHRNFKPLMVNQAWVDLMRAPSVEHVLEHVRLYDFIPEEHRGDAFKRNEDILSGAVQGSHSVVENICFDGERRYFNIYDNLIEWDGEPAVQAVIEDVTEKVKLERELAYKASHDALTNLLNREAIYSWLNETLKSCRTIVCFLIDIDDFKSVNDTYGHFCGDEIIKCIAGSCKEFVGEEGVVGRWGGEEFIIFYPDLSLNQAIERAEALRRTCEVNHCAIDEETVSRTISIGVAHHEIGSDGCTVPDEKCINHLIRMADKQLYLAKTNGKNCIKF